jgi:hypothetical protein
MRVYLLGSSLLSLVALAGCSAADIPPITQIKGASFIALRCVNASDDGLTGLPLEGCGCSAVETDDAGNRRLRMMGRVECACETLAVTDGATSRVAVGHVQVDPEVCMPVMGESGCQTGWDCAPTLGADGEWQPLFDTPAAGASTPGAAGCPAVPARPSGVACVPAGSGQLRGYVGSPNEGSITVVDLTEGEPVDANKDPKRVVDIDRTIPGSTALFVDDLITDVAAHPFGDFIFTVNSSSGSLSVIKDDRAVRENRRVALDFGPLLEVVTWPSVAAPGPDLAQTPMAYLSAPQAGLVVPVLLDGVGDAEDFDFVQAPIVLLDPAGAPATPGRLGISQDGTQLFVGHVRRALVAVYDLTSEPATLQGTIDLAPVKPCADAYLVGVLAPEDDPTCTDGLDNDGDGAVDAADTGCMLPNGSEARVLGCPQQSQCADGADNDDDGLVDLEDPDCQLETAGCADAACRATFVQFEGTPPACADGLPGDDGDDLTDRADPDCANERDDSEAGVREIAACVLTPSAAGCDVPTCQDGRDNDGDGATDLADSDCSVVCATAPCEAAEGPGLPMATGGDVEDTVCHNGLDDDGDGLVDAEDPGCSDFNAIDRYAFERAPRCADGVDNDQDGHTDFAGGDPECFAASDDNESGLAEAVGPRAIEVVDVPTPTGLRRFVYMLDPNGNLSVADAADPELRPYRLSLPSPVQSFTVRQYDNQVSLLLIGADTVLRSIEVTVPRELRTPEGLPLFARLASDDDGGGIERLYAVQAGQARDVVLCAADAPLVDEAGAPVPCRDGASALWAGVELLSDSQWPAPAVSEDRRLGPWTVVQLPPDQVLRMAVPGDLPEDYVAVPVRSEDLNVDRGVRDYVLAEPLQSRRLSHREGNVRTSAALRTNQVGAPARLRINDAAASSTLDRHPVFCRLDVDEGCVPAGFVLDANDEARAAALADLSSAGIHEASATEAIAQAPNLVAGWSGVEVLVDDPARIIAGTYSLSYEGAVPSTVSRKGQHGGLSDGGDGWTLLDYDADFCRRGVEPGDVVLVDRFRAVTTEVGEGDLCRAFNPVPSQDQMREREPLRYVVESVGQHKLVLKVDGREAYCDATGDCQLPRNDRSSVPTLAAPPAAPPYACAAQFISYRVRAGHDQWILVGDRSGYRHPWVASGGQCVADAGRVAAGRIGRATLGTRFENEWFRFWLGMWSGPGGLEGALPHQIDSVYQFEVSTGSSVRGIAEVALAPQELRWSPLDDRLYVVDAGLQTLVEVADFDVYFQQFRVVQKIQ